MATPETAFQLQRDIVNTFDSVSLITTAIAANETTYSDTSTEPNTTYYYRLRAMDGDNGSDWTLTVSVTTPPPRVDISGFGIYVEGTHTPAVRVGALGAYAELRRPAVLRVGGVGLYIEVSQIVVAYSTLNDLKVVVHWPGYTFSRTRSADPKPILNGGYCFPDAVFSGRVWTGTLSVWDTPPDPDLATAAELKTLWETENVISWLDIVGCAYTIEPNVAKNVILDSPFAIQWDADGTFGLLNFRLVEVLL